MMTPAPKKKTNGTLIGVVTALVGMLTTIIAFHLQFLIPAISQQTRVQVEEAVSKVPQHPETAKALRILKDSIVDLKGDIIKRLERLESRK